MAGHRVEEFRRTLLTVAVATFLVIAILSLRYHTSPAASAPVPEEDTTAVTVSDTVQVSVRPDTVQKPHGGSAKRRSKRVPTLPAVRDMLGSPVPRHDTVPHL